MGDFIQWHDCLHHLDEHGHGRDPDFRGSKIMDVRRRMSLCMEWAAAALSHVSLTARVVEGEALGTSIEPVSQGFLVTTQPQYFLQPDLRQRDVIVAIEGRPLDVQTCGGRDGQAIALAEGLRHGVSMTVLRLVPLDSSLADAPFHPLSCRPLQSEEELEEHAKSLGGPSKGDLHAPPFLGETCVRHVLATLGVRPSRSSSEHLATI